MNRQITVPVFVPHAGCPHDCSFCNQRHISGVMKLPTAAGVRKILMAVQQSLGERMYSAELAFFGGSFTAIPQAYRLSLLEAAKPFVGPSGFRGIRISTRPDCIDEVVLSQLKQYGVTTIELGVQSMSNPVLAANNRGHTAEDTVNASLLIRSFGFSLGHQMMTGLYGDNDISSLETAEQIIRMKPDMVRIYPTVVLEGTTLAGMWQDGSYRPQTLEQAVVLGAQLLERFQQGGIPVIRLGLHDEAGLQDSMLAGPHHPALRELCEGKLLLGRVIAQLEQGGLSGRRIQLRVHPTAVSKMTGQKRCNLVQLNDRGYEAVVIADEMVQPMQVVVKPAG